MKEKNEGGGGGEEENEKWICNSKQNKKIQEWKDKAKRKIYCEL